MFKVYSYKIVLKCLPHNVLDAVPLISRLFPAFMDIHDEKLVLRFLEPIPGGRLCLSSEIDLVPDIK